MWVCWFKREKSVRNAGTFLEEKEDPLPPHAYDFETTRLSGKVVERGIRVLFHGLCRAEQPRAQQFRARGAPLSLAAGRGCSARRGRQGRCERGLGTAPGRGQEGPERGEARGRGTGGEQRRDSRETQ